MTKRAKNIKLAVLAVIFFGGILLLFNYRVGIKQSFEDWNRVRKLPKAISVEASTSSVLEISNTEKLNSGDSNGKKVEKKISEVKNQLPAEINLKVPFVLQAPNALWDALHEDACEEASVIMFNAFFKKKTGFTKQEMEDAIQKVVAWEKNKFGFFEDTTVEETVQILKEYFGLTGVKAVYDITIDDIKKELAAGRPVIVPAAGKLLFNPNFRGGGPPYHMLVIKGYTKNGYFITNDPGTKRGADYIYKIDVLYKAIHDWVPGGNVLDGRKAMIVVR
ncbi:MAG: C39 family peptidase [Patescibacteria group bacterium]